MAWELRHGKPVFYASQRVGEKVVKTYLGRGMAAQYAAAGIEQAKQLRAKRRADFHLVKTRVSVAMTLARRFAAESNDLMIAQLDEFGFHSPKGRGWRRRYEKRD